MIKNLEQALEYYKLGFSVIPLIPKTKRAAIRWGRYQKVRANKEQIQRWFEKTVNDIAILTGRVSGIIEIDIDGEEAALHFHKAVETIEDEAVRKNIENTMKIKTGSGNLNYIFGINVADFVDGEVIKTSVLWRGDKGHSEITLKGDGGYAVAPPSEHPSGNRYELVDGILSRVLLSKQQLMKLVTALKQNSKRKPSSTSASNTNLTPDIYGQQITHIVSLIKPHYRLGSRNSFVMYLSGWLKKEGILIESARKVIQGICEDDEEKDARLRTLEETYQKEAVNDIKGYSGLLEILKDELGDERKAQTFLDELRSLLEQVQKKDEEDELDDEDQERKSIVKDASEAMMRKHRLLTIEETKEILYYHNGVYVPGGEVLIEKEENETQTKVLLLV
jgi:hypothetical protein